MPGRRCLRSLLALAATLASLAGTAAAQGAPRVLFLDVESGPVRGGPGGLGVPITIYGRGFGPRQAGSRVTIGGVAPARVLSWGRAVLAPHLDAIVVQPGSRVRGGPVVVTVAGTRSNRDRAFTARTGRILEVAPGGSDGGPCSAARPCATIQHAATERLQAGDVLLVRGGTYEEGEIWLRGDQGDSGAPDRPKAILAYPGERVVLANAERPFIVDASFVTVAGVAFANGRSLGIPDVGLPGHRGNRFVGNAFAGTLGYSAIDVHGDGHEILGNVCRAAGSTVGTQGHCIYVSYGDGVALRFNVAGGAPGYGIHVFDQERAADDFRRTISNLLVEGNLLEGSTERSGLIVAMGDEGGRGNLIRGVRIRGNTFRRNNHLGLVLGPNVRDVTIRGNRFVDNGRQGLHVSDDPTIAGVTVVANAFRQAENDACRQDCSWYPLAHVQVGARARDVVLGENRYGPGRPIVLRRTRD